MNGKTMRALVRAGWKVGTATELLKLTPEEVALVELRLRLVAAVRVLRAKQQLTQAGLAQRARVRRVRRCRRRSEGGGS